MCLDVDTYNSTHVSVVVKNSQFIGENDDTLPRSGYKTYNITTSAWEGDKSRGHAIAINAIAGSGTAGSVLIDNNTITGTRGNAIQLYGFDYAITVSNNTINSWGKNASNASGTKDDAAIRGDIKTNGSLTLTNNYFGLDESESPRQLYHVNVKDYTANTDHTRVKGTY